MNLTQDIQNAFLNLIKEKLPPNLSLVDEISDLLSISRDSAYRRIRGETALDLGELQKLCLHFNVSIDNLLNLKSNSVTFNYRAIDRDNFTFEEYLKSILENLQTINAFENRELIYAAKDIPVFYHYMFREIAAFKIFFWLKTLIHDPELENAVFAYDKVSESLLNTSRGIWETYIKTPCMEIWSEENVNVTLRQLSYCWETGTINDKEMMLDLIDKVRTMLEHLRKQAELGQKFEPGLKPPTNEQTLQVYANEVAIADNSIFFKMGGTRIAFLTYNTLNILSTSNAQVCSQMESWIDNLIKKSTLISGVSEKERNKFFRIVLGKIDQFRERIQSQ